MTPTKKTTTRKSKTGRTTTRTATRSRASARIASTGAVSETFATNPQEEAHVAVPNDSVLLFVNGTNKGVVKHEGKTLADFVTAKARSAGIRTFSVYMDGVKADTSMSARKLAGVSKLEIVAKDARG